MWVHNMYAHTIYMCTQTWMHTTWMHPHNISARTQHDTSTSTSHIPISQTNTCLMLWSRLVLHLSTTEFRLLLPWPSPLCPTYKQLSPTKQSHSPTCHAVFQKPRVVYPHTSNYISALSPTTTDPHITHGNTIPPQHTHNLPHLMMMSMSMSCRGTHGRILAGLHKCTREVAHNITLSTTHTTQGNTIVRHPLSLFGILDHKSFHWVLVQSIQRRINVSTLLNKYTSNYYASFLITVGSLRCNPINPDNSRLIRTAGNQYRCTLVGIVYKTRRHWVEVYEGQRECCWQAV